MSSKAHLPASASGVGADASGDPGPSVARCAELANAETKNRILAAAQAYGRAAESGNHFELVGGKSDFHALLVAAGGNTFAGQALSSLQDRISLLRIATLGEPGRLAVSASDIRAIAIAIAACDSAAASEACRPHVENEAAVAHRMRLENIID